MEAWNRCALVSRTGYELGGAYWPYRQERQITTYPAVGGYYRIFGREEGGPWTADYCTRSPMAELAALVADGWELIAYGEGWGETIEAIERG